MIRLKNPIPLAKRPREFGTQNFFFFKVSLLTVGRLKDWIRSNNGLALGTSVLQLNCS